LAPVGSGWSGQVLNLNVTFDSYASDTSWDVTDVTSGEIIASSTPCEDGTLTAVESICIENVSTSCYELSFYDYYGDGIYEPGGYVAALDGEVLAAF